MHQKCNYLNWIRINSELRTYKWICSMLVQRSIFIKNMKDYFRITSLRSYIQGGVTSLLLWYLVVDHLPIRLVGKSYMEMGYSDDLVIICEMYDSIIFQLMQSVLDVVWNGYRQHGLGVHFGNIIIVRFTRRRKLQ